MGCSKAEERARETCCVLFFSFCFDTRVFFVFLLTPCTAFFRNNNNNNKREKEAPLDPIIDAQMYSDLMNRKGGGKKVIFFWFVFFVVFFFDRFNRASLEKKTKAKENGLNYVRKEESARLSCQLSLPRFCYYCFLSFSLPLSLSLSLKNTSLISKVASSFSQGSTFSFFFLYTG